MLNEGKKFYNLDWCKINSRKNFLKINILKRDKDGEQIAILFFFLISLYSFVLKWKNDKSIS